MERCAHAAEPRLTGIRWLRLLFGALLFSRASVLFLAHADQIRSEIAEALSPVLESLA